MMGNWGFGTKDQLTPFENSVRWLTPAAKQAFYAAAASRTIKRRTWNGCAFNAGGEEIGIRDINSIQAAADAFDIPVKSVSNFIHQWDSLIGSDDECNTMLRNAIVKVGLFSPRGTLRLRKLVFADRMDEKENAVFEQIDRYVSDPEIKDEELWTLIDGYKEAEQLIGV